MEKLNIAEILKDCPSGIKLYSTIHGEVELVDIYHDLIRCKFTYGITFVSFHSDGRWIEHVGECVLFPSKDQRDWSKFHRPFVDGDILTSEKGSIFIYKGPMYYNKMLSDFYCGYRKSDGAFVPKLFKDKHFGDVSECRFATEKEKQQLFDAIVENGYKWNPETKTLEDWLKPKFKVGDKIQNRVVKTNNVYTVVGIKGLKYFVNMNNEKHNYEIDFEVQDDWELVSVVPKFKVGDSIKLNNSTSTYTIIDILKDRYRVTCNSYGLHEIEFERQDDYKLFPNKFDITTLKPFDKVLVRQSDTDYWKPAFWGKRITSKSYPFITSFGHTTQAIPFKHNEWLVGTTDDCNDYYKTWV
jgi:hypothetical protein